MLITERFVMLNIPKTGSTFARTVLKELHAPRGLRKLLPLSRSTTPGLREILFPALRFRDVGWNYPDQHGIYVQIPERYARLPVMSIVRDPLERLISVYEFRHWALFPGNVEPQIRAAYPHFPDLSFEEYLDVADRFIFPALMPEGMAVDIGQCTYHMIRFFARDPLRTFLALRPDMDLAAERDRHFAPIKVLHTEDLSRELYDFLLGVGYPEERLSFILDKPKVNTTDRTRPKYLTPEMIGTLLHRERFFYQLFPEYLPR